MFTITTDRLLIRDLQDDDWRLFYDLMKDEETRYYMGDFITASTEEEARAWVNTRMAYNAENPRYSYNLAIVWNDAVVGWIGIGDADDDDKKDLDFGYAMIKTYRGKGIMTEALKGLLQFCFENLAIHRITGDCEIDNTGSRKVMEHAGMTLVKTVTVFNEPTGTYREKYRFEICR